MGGAKQKQTLSGIQFVSQAMYRKKMAVVRLCSLNIAKTILIMTKRGQDMRRTRVKSYF